MKFIEKFLLNSSIQNRWLAGCVFYLSAMEPVSFVSKKKGIQNRTNYLYGKSQKEN